MQNRKGNTLRGIATLPDGVEKMPCVLLLHGFGGSAAGYKGLNIRIARDLAEAGIACIRFDFYGNGESDGEFEDMTFTGLYEDAEDMFRWMGQQSFANPDKLFLSGQSMGGYALWQLAMSMPEYFAAIAPICGGGMYWNAQDRKSVV